MKNILYKYNLLKEITNTKVYKGLFLFIILWMFFHFSMLETNNTGEAILDYFNSYFGVSVLLIVMLISAYTMKKIFNERLNIILRYNNLKKHFKELSIYILLSNIVIYLIFWIILLIFSIFSCGLNFGIYSIYDIPTIVYILFTFIKMFLLANVFVMLAMCLEKITFKFFGTIFLLIVLGINYITPITTTEGIVYGFKIDYSYYFYSLPYERFLTEISYSFGMIIILYIIYFVFYNVVLIKNKSLN